MTSTTDTTVAFGLVVVGAWAWGMFGGDTFPAEKDPTGDPNGWTREELRRWLAAVSDEHQSGSEDQSLTFIERNLFPLESDTREELLERVKLNMRHPPK